MEMDLEGIQSNASDQPSRNATGTEDIESNIHNSCTNSLEFDRFYGDGSFLKLLQETLQKNVNVLKKGEVKLALSPTAIAYLNDRLHNTLCPRRSADKSGRIKGWTIRQETKHDSFHHVLSPKYGEGFIERDFMPVGHLDVLKLSTLLSEATFLKVKPGAESDVAHDLHLELFPSLEKIELQRIKPESVNALSSFVPQLKSLECIECTIFSPHAILHHGTWERLVSLKFERCEVEEWSPSEMLQVPVLKSLEIIHNNLHELRNLPAAMTLTTATVRCCRLKSFTLSEPFPALTHLVLDHNSLASLTSLPLQLMENLEYLDLTYNLLVDLASLSVLRQMKKLTTLKLFGNPISRFPDYRRQVLFYLDEKVELDDVPWTWTELDSMRFSRHSKGSKGILTYPILCPKPLQLQPRHVVITGTKPPYLTVPKRLRAHSSLSDTSNVSSQRKSIDMVETDDSGCRSRVASYHVDEFLRDLADEESFEEQPNFEIEHVMPPTTSGIPTTIYLSMEQAETLELPLGHEGIGGVIHITPTKLMEYLPGGAIVQRYRSNLLCMALYSPSNSLTQMTIQLGFRNKPTVAYKIGNVLHVAELVKEIFHTLKRKSINGYKCYDCGAFVVSYERKRSLFEPFIVNVFRCWICKSSNGREYTATSRIIRCIIDMGIKMDDEERKPKPIQMNQQGFIIEADYDDMVVLRDEIVWIITDTFMKEVKLSTDIDDEHTNDIDDYRRLCGLG